MSSRIKSRPWVCLLTAHIESALHVQCILAWSMHGFLQYEGLSRRQAAVESIVEPILSVTHFPGFQMLGLESDTPSIIASFVTGYLIGIVFGCFATDTVMKPRIASFIWWPCALIMMIDILCVILLGGFSARFILAFLRLLLVLVPVTAFASIVVWQFRAFHLGGRKGH